MNLFFQFSYAFSLLPTAVICGAWWYAAIQKRKVSIFYWLAATHSFALVVQVLQISNTLGERNIARIQSLASVGMLVHVALAALYVMLVRWLVNQSDDRGQDIR